MTIVLEEPLDRMPDLHLDGLVERVRLEPQHRHQGHASSETRIRIPPRRDHPRMQSKASPMTEESS